MERIDPHTGEKFTPKRANQIFASRKNQVAYNNAKTRKKRAKMELIDKHNRKNWRVLNSILGLRRRKVATVLTLKSKGFNFNFFNNIRRHDGKKFYCVYDFGIFVLENGLYEIVKFGYDE